MIGIFVFLKTFDINRYKPQLLSQAKNALGREIDLEKIDLDFHFKTGVRLNIKNLRMSEVSDFPKGEFLKIANAYLGIDIFSYLTRKQILITSIELDTPKLFLVREKENPTTQDQTSLSFFSPGPEPRIGEEQTQAKGALSQPRDLLPSSTSDIFAKTKSAGTTKLPDIFIKSLELKKGMVHYIDKNFDPHLVLDIVNVYLKITHLNFKEPFSFSLGLAMASQEPNIFMEGKAILDLNHQNIQIREAALSTDLAQFSLEKLKKDLPMLKGVRVPDELKGKLKVDIQSLLVGPQGLSDLSLNVKISEGRVNLKEIVPGISLDIAKIEGQIKNFNLKDYFPVTLQAALLSNQPNITINGLAAVDLNQQIFRMKEIGATADLSTLSMAQLASLGAGPENIQGKLNVTVDQFEASSQGLKTLILKGELLQGLVNWKGLSQPINSMSCQFEVSETKIDLKDFKFRLGKGSLSAKGSVEDYLKSQNFQMDLNLDGLDLEEVIDQKDQPVKVKGLLFGKFMTQGQGFDPQKTLNSMNGQGELEMREGRLADLNILKTVLDKISLIPDLVEQLEAALPERYKEILTHKDTMLNKVNFSITIQDGKLLIKPIEIDADGFLLEGQAQAGFNQEYSLEGSLIIPADLSASMVQLVSPLQYLFDESQRIFIPLGVSGRFPQFNFSVDLAYLGKRLIENKGKEELKKVINKVFDRENNQPIESPDAPADQPEQKRPEQEIIENILDSIFK